jgi:hypothetical protein
MQTGWHPDYSERYYTVNAKLIGELQSRTNLHLAVNRYMWLDIDDDYKALNESLVFQTEEEALKCANYIFDNKQ